MDFDDYQLTAYRTAVYPGQKTFLGVCYTVLGLVGEGGEVAEQVKKAWRNDGSITAERKAKIADELGDVLWYVSQTCEELGLSMSDIAEANCEKLRKRQSEGKLKVHDSTS